MYQIQEDKLSYFEKEIDNPNRKITYKFTLNDEPLEANQIMDNPTLTTDTGLDQYGVGCALVTQLQMSVHSDVAIKSKDKITIEIGLDIYNEVTEKWETLNTSLGVFYVDALEEKGMKKSIKAYDGMYKLQNGYFPTAQHTTTQAIANDIATANGYKVKGISNVTINNEQLEGKTCLEMLSLVASAIGGHVRISRDGSTIEFVTPANYGSVFTESDYSTPTIDDTTQYNITKLRVNYSDQVTDEEGEVTDEGYFEVGEGTDAQTLAISNPLLKGKKSQAQAILTKIKAMNGYKRFDAKLPLGDFRLDTMDTVSYFYKDKMYIVPILYMKMVLSYGGVSIETQSPTVAETKTEFSFKGTLSQKVENIYTDIIQVKQLTAGKVSTDELEATVATIEKLYAQKAEIEELYATKAEIGDLVAGSVAVEDLKAQIAEIDKAIINKADITDLNAVNATINSLKANVAEIDDLLANSIISQIIQSGSVSSDLLNVKDGFIKDAMIDSLNASKINSGVINTNNVTIQSNNGNMLLQGNLLQFKDKNGTVRIQIGQDTTGNYTFTLYDSTGKGVLINQDGIQSSNAIKDGLIVDSKVSSNANISGSKLNISSLYDSMNADGSKTLKASKVMLDEQGQTLDVSFKEMTTKQDELEDSMSTVITDISVAQGQISQLIQDTTITTSSGTTTLKDAYNSTKSTVDSHTTQIGEMQTTIDSNTGEITNVKSDVATISADLDKIELSLSSVEKNIGDNYYTKSQTDSQIKASKEAIELGVSETYETKTEVTNKINAVQVGGRNYIQFSDFKNNTSEWIQSKHSSNTGSSTVADGVMTITSSGSDWIQRQIYSNKTATTLLNIKNNNQYTFSAEVMVESVSTGVAVIDFRVNYTSGSTSNRLRLEKDLSTLTPGVWTKIEKTGIVTYTEDSFNYWRIIPQGVLGQTVKYRNFKLEDGNKSTSWTPAPEDVDGAISTAQTTAISESKTYSDSQIKLATDSITSSVSNTYETKSNVNALKNQINQTKQNIRCNNLGAKINYSAFSTANEGEIYLHGYDSNNNPTDTNGTIYWNGSTLTVIKGMINPDSKFPFGSDVYIFVNKNSSSFVYGCYFDTTTKTWAYAGLIGTTQGNTNWTPTINHVAIGVFNMVSAEVFNHAYLFETPQSLISLTIGSDNLTSRMNSAEQKITSDAIVSTVTSSQTYKDNLTDKVSKTEVISSINQTAEAVKINANKIELTGDVVINAINGTTSTSISGNKIKTGTIASSDGTLTFDLNNAQIRVNDDSGNRVGVTVRNKYNNGTTNIYGMSSCSEYNYYTSMSVKDSSTASSYTMYVTCVAQDNLVGNYLTGVNIGKPIHLWGVANFKTTANFTTTYATSHRATNGYFDTLRTNTSPNNSATEINVYDSLNMNLWNIRNPILKWDGFTRSSGDKFSIEKYSSSESHLRVIIADDYQSWFTILHNHYTNGLKTVCNFGYASGTIGGAEGSVGIKMWKTLSLNNWGIYKAGTINGATVNALALNLESDTVTVQSSSPLVLFAADDFIDIDVPTKTQYMMTSTTNTINHHGRIEVLDKAEYIELPSDFLMCENINVVATPNKICKFAITSIDEYGFVVECDEENVTFSYHVIADKIDIMTLTERKSNIKPIESTEEESDEKPIEYKETEEEFEYEEITVK